VSRHPVPGWTLRFLRAAQLALLLVFIAHFVSVQVNAAAYLAGRDHPVVGAAAAVIDIVAGLAFEAVAAVILFIAAVMLRALIRERRQAITRV
jgi:hypothetical protein